MKLGRKWTKNKSKNSVQWQLPGECWCVPGVTNMELVRKPTRIYWARGTDPNRIPLAVVLCRSWNERVKLWCPWGRTKRLYNCNCTVIFLNIWIHFCSPTCSLLRYNRLRDCSPNHTVQVALQFPHWLGVHKYNPYLSVSETVVDDQNANRHHGTESPLTYPHSNSSSPLRGTGLHESPQDRVGGPHGPRRRQKLYE